MTSKIRQLTASQRIVVGAGAVATAAAALFGSAATSLADEFAKSSSRITVAADGPVIPCDRSKADHCFGDSGKDANGRTIRVPRPHSNRGH